MELYGVCMELHKQFSAVSSKTRIFGVYGVGRTVLEIRISILGHRLYGLGCAW